MNTEHAKNGEMREAFSSLRKLVLDEQRRVVKKRKTNNPTCSLLEKILGVYLEEIEPQVRAAVVSFNEKGYETYSSGFDETDARYQLIEGKFSVSDAIKLELEKSGVEVIKGERIVTDFMKTGDNGDITIIRFCAKYPNLQDISRMWNAIVNMFPTIV